MAKSGKFAQTVTLVDLATWLQWPSLQCAKVAMPMQSGLLSMQLVSWP